MKKSGEEVMNNIGWFALVAWVITAVLAYFGLGGYLYESVEGMDRSMIPLGPVIAFCLMVVTSIVITVMWARQLGSSESDPELAPSGRRKFLMGSAVVTGGVIGVGAATATKMSGWLQTTGPALQGSTELTSPNVSAEWAGSQIVHKRPLGRTGFMVSDISVGTTRFMRHADPEAYLTEILDRGVNYIDTSPDYAGSESETIIGNVISNRNREELFVVTKWCTADGHVRQGASPEVYLAALDDSLSRLQTDYVDLIHVHACDTVERLLDPNMLEAFEMAKAQGKVKFLGVSTHTPNLEEVAYAAIDSGKIDVMMLAYHHGAWPKQVDIINKAAEKGVGIVAMKTLKGAKHKGMMEFQDESTSYTQASFKWVMSNPAVACLVVSFFDTQHIDEYLHASGKPLTNEDVAVLNKYDELIAGTHCFTSCGDCLTSCPSSLPINDVLRHRMYFEDYGDQKNAMELYAKLEKQADACIGCAAPCQGACPEGINIQDRMIGAHQRLTLTA